MYYVVLAVPKLGKRRSGECDFCARRQPLIDEPLQSTKRRAFASCLEALESGSAPIPPGVRRGQSCRRHEHVALEPPDSHREYPRATV